MLQQLDTSIIAVDRAPLAPEIGANERTKALTQNAFALEPEEYPEVTWLFSDLICYPEALLEWLLKWIKAKPELSCVCTLKFKDNADYSIAAEFAKISHSKIVHLFHNKHELTFLRNPSV